MGLRLESRLPPSLLWPSWVWTFIAAETLLVIWCGVRYMPPDVLIEAHFWHRAVLLGSPGGPLGLLRLMVLVNILAVVGLWVAVRSAGHQPRRFFVPMALTGVVGAMVLAAIAWSTVPLRELYRPIEVYRVLELDDAGNYRILE